MKNADRRTLALCLSLVTLLPIGCAVSAESSASSRVINGTNVPGSQFPTVGEVGDSSFFDCTGTLISPTHVLTAGHCLTDGTGQLTVAQTGGRFRLNGTVYNSVHIYVNPAWKGGANGDAEGEFDAIVMELDHAVPGVTPTPLYRQAPTVGQLLTIAGYGEQGTGDTGRNGTYPAPGTITYGTTPIDIVTGTYIKWNFTKTTPIEANTAPGDSGGPAFITVNGTLYIAGITNGGQLDSAAYGDQSYDTRVDAIAAWIDSVTNNATAGGGTSGSGSGGGTTGSSNNPPVIDSPATATPTVPAVNAPVSFTVSASDPDGDTLTYSWDFGDGTQSRSVASRVINGTNVPGSQFPTVGEVGDSSFFDCTGTLISPTHVLTAGHCLTDGNGQLTVAQTGGRFRLNGTVYNSVHIYVNPAWKGGANGDAEGEFDAIVMELDHAVPGVTPTPLYRQAPTVGQLLTIAGYGEQGTGDTGRNGTYPAAGTITYGTTPIDIVTGTYIKWNFTKTTPIEANTAPGDSGGPAFITVNGTLYIAGITNGGQLDSAAYGDQSYDTRVDAIAAWIDSVTNNATAGGGGTTTPSTGTPNPSSGATGQSVSHSYAAAGTYTATVTVDDGNGGVTASSVTVTVGGIPVSASRCNFRLNFRQGSRDSMNLTIQSGQLASGDRQSFASKVDGMSATVIVGSTNIDTLTLSANGSGAGQGRLRWTRSGIVRYQIRNASLATLLEPFGATNMDGSASVTVPFVIQLGGAAYTSSYNFNYTARQDKFGQGK